MNKYTLIFVSTILILGLLCVPSNSLNKTEINEIENILSNKENFIISESHSDTVNESCYGDYNLENAEKIYFSEALMLTAYEEEKTIDSIVSEKYQLCVPLGESEQSVAIFSVKEDGVTFSGSRLSEGYYLSDTEIREIVVNSNIEPSTIISIRRVFSPMYHTTYAIIETGVEVYAIPFASNEEFLGLENKKLYVFDEMMQFLINRFDESELLENQDSFGGVPLRKNNSILVICVIIISLVLIFVCTILLIKRKKRKNK